MILDVWIVVECFKRFKIAMKRFSEELEVSRWERFRPRETFNEKVIR